MINYIFERILLLSASGALISVILLSASIFTKKFFSSRWHYYTYVAALLVFLIPLSFKAENINDEIIEREKTAIVFSVQPQEDGDVRNSEEIEKRDVSAYDFAAVFKYGFLIWLSGAIIYFGFTVISHFVLTHKLQRNSYVVDCKEPLSQLGCQKLSAFKTSLISSPMLTGIIRPVLFLPDTHYSESDLRNILCHECVHYKRRDIIIKWICAVAKAIHWFNPAIFLLSRKIDAECEISCDIEATSSFETKELQGYCETILSLISAKTPKASPTLHMGDKKKNLERRFKAIMEEKKHSRKTAVISAVIAAVLLLGAFTASAIMGGKTTKESNDAPDVEYKLITTEETSQENAVHPVYETEIKTEASDAAGAKISADFDKDKHPAADYILERDTVITSPIEGTIKKAEYDYEKGNHIEIGGYDGSTSIIFAHLDKMYVSAGEKVNVGDQIGTVGTTGMSTGPHLHVEYHENGEALNPISIFIVEENGEIRALYSEPVLLPTEEH